MTAFGRCRASAHRIVPPAPAPYASQPSVARCADPVAQRQKQYACARVATNARPSAPLLLPVKNRRCTYPPHRWFPSYTRRGFLPFSASHAPSASGLNRSIAAPPDAASIAHAAAPLPPARRNGKSQTAPDSPRHAGPRALAPTDRQTIHWSEKESICRHDHCGWRPMPAPQDQVHSPKPRWLA